MMINKDQTKRSIRNQFNVMYRVSDYMHRGEIWIHNIKGRMMMSEDREQLKNNETCISKYAQFVTTFLKTAV